LTFRELYFANCRDTDYLRLRSVKTHQFIVNM